MREFSSDNVMAKKSPELDDVTQRDRLTIDQTITGIAQVQKSLSRERTGEGVARCLPRKRGATGLVMGCGHICRGTRVANGLSPAYFYIVYITYMRDLARSIFEGIHFESCARITKVLAEVIPGIPQALQIITDHPQATARRFVAPLRLDEGRYEQGRDRIVGISGSFSETVHDHLTNRIDGLRKSI